MRAAWLVFLVATAITCRAAADESSDAPRVVDLYLAASDSEAPAMEKVARELLERLDVTIRLTRIEHVDPRVVVKPDRSAAPAVARVWVDLTGEGPRTLCVVDAPWERVLVRHLPPASDEVTRETAAHILETAVDALLRGEHLGIERDKVEVPAPPPPPPIAVPPKPPPRPNLLRGDASLAYEAQVFGPGPVIRQGPELSVALTVGQGRWRPGALFGLQYRIPAIVDDIPVGLRFDSFATRAVGILDVVLSSRTTLRSGLGLSLDFDRVSPRAGTNPAVHIGQVESYLTPLARLCVGADVALLEHIALDFGAAIDIDFTGTEYVAVGGTTSVVDFAPWPVRPALYLGLEAR
jgi:hypothetical protein